MNTKTSHEVLSKRVLLMSKPAYLSTLQSPTTILLRRLLGSCLRLIQKDMINYRANPMEVP